MTPFVRDMYSVCGGETLAARLNVYGDGGGGGKREDRLRNKSLM